MILFNRSCKHEGCRATFITTNRRKLFHSRACERKFNASHYITIRIDEYRKLKELVAELPTRKIA